MALNCVSMFETETVTNSLFSEANLANYIREISKYPSLTLEEEQELAKQFIAKNGSIVCAQIIKTDDATSTSPTPSERTSEYYKKRPCAEYVGDACEILENYLTEKGLM